MEEQETESIVEERQEFMVSLTGASNPTMRIAYFLKPTFKASNFKLKSLPPSSLPPKFDSKRKPPNVNFKGWQYPSSEWKSWVDNMEEKYQQVWKKAGIFGAIKSSTCTVHKDSNLIKGIAETWNPDTNTFVFSWGEATISLEDLIVLGGYSVVGDNPVFAYRDESREVSEVEEKLRKARTELGRTATKKASQGGWMKMFMFSGSDIEHEAFLSFWLERFVLRESGRILRAKVFQVAIRLAQGERLALAPAVLGSIYRDLSLLKAAIVANSQLGRNETGDYDTLEVTLWSPFHFVQLWIWERFEAFRPRPNVIKSGEPRSALWDKVKVVQISNVRRVLDSAGETFCWRPYATGSQFYAFYKKNEEWVDVRSNDDLFSFSLCLRVSELVGIDCLEQYLPHRVAMQFGIDQDIPDCVSSSDEGPELAWINYIRPFGDRKLRIPSLLVKPDVTCCYLDWWKKSVLRLPEPKDLINSVIRRKRSEIKRSKQTPQVSFGKEVDVDADAPPGFASKCKKAKIADTIDMTVADVPPGFPTKCDNSKIKDMLTVKRERIAGDVPPGFPPKCDNGKIKDVLTIKRERTDGDVLLDFPPKCDNSKIKDMLTVKRGRTDGDVLPGFPPEYNDLKIKDMLTDKRERIDGDFPPGFPPKCENPHIKDTFTVKSEPTDENVCVSDRSSRGTGLVSGQPKGLSSVNINSVATEKLADGRMEVNSGVSESVRAMEYSLVIKPRISDDGKAITNESQDKIIAEASALEARISTIEREIAKLKVAGFRI